MVAWPFTRFADVSKLRTCKVQVSVSFSRHALVLATFKNRRRERKNTKEKPTTKRQSCLLSLFLTLHPQVDM